MRDIISISIQEISRLEVMQCIKAKELTQTKAALMLGLSLRQIRRLYAAYNKQGAVALVSKKRGMPSNNRISEGIKQSTLALIRKHYYDFGPTLACEKLREIHGLDISLGSVRRLMIDQEIWETRSKKKRKVHQLRNRREAYGELVQIE